MLFRRSHSVRAAVLALALAAPAVSLGAGAAADEELREVIVTARSLEVTTPLELSRYGNDVEFVTSKQIRDQGFVDTTRALEMLVPGAYVAPQAGAFSYVNLSLQGSRTSDVLWTVDGVRINNRLYNGTSPADTLPASMIERIEVLKGGQGLLYGTQAAAGVINIVTRAFSATPGGAISVGADSRDGTHLNGYGRGAVGDHRFVAWASRDKSDGYSLLDAYQPDATTRDRQYYVDSFGLKYGYDFTDSARLTVQGVHTEAALDYPGVASTNVNDRDEDTLSARLDIEASDTVQLFVKGYLHDWDTSYYPATDPDDSAFWGYKDFGLSAAASMKLARGLEYHVGYDFQNYRGRDEVLLIEGLTEKAHAAYVQLRTTDDLSAHGRLAAGVRYNDTGGATATVWNTSGVYHFSESLYVEGTVGTSFLLPDAYQLYAIDPFDTRGNPDLKPEKSFNINVSIGGRLGAGELPATWQLTGWKRRIKNLITDDDTNPPAGFDTVFINSDATVKATGAEALLRVTIAPGWTVDASYMYSQERDAGSRQQHADRPIHSAKLGVGVEPAGSSIGASLALKYAGTAHASPGGGYGPQPYGDVVIADLAGWWYLDGEPRHHRLGLRVENLFDGDYATRVRQAVLAGSTPATRFLYRNRGAPRTGFLNYSYTF
ncbi:MAG: TonB-dependent receptor [Steroidobacteraceae bacterium]